ncbi:helix-turn-helix domain-containing protein [Ferruginibacter sp.]
MEIGHFPNKLKMFRRACGYSQKKVAKLLGLSCTSALSRWEQGFSLPSIMQLFRLAHIYKIQPNELFDELWQQLGEPFNLLAQDSEPINSSESFHL